MGALIGVGFLAITLVLYVLMAVVGLFITNIIMFDSIVLALAGGICANTLLHIHPAFCLLIGIGLFIGLLFLQRTMFGFWLIGGVLSLFWAFVFGFIAYTITNDMIWCYVIMGLSVVLMIGLHLKAKADIDLL